jgi:hypothetical protein
MMSGTGKGTAEGKYTTEYSLIGILTDVTTAMGCGGERVPGLYAMYGNNQTELNAITVNT